MKSGLQNYLLHLQVNEFDDLVKSIITGRKCAYSGRPFADHLRTSFIINVFMFLIRLTCKKSTGLLFNFFHILESAIRHLFFSASIFQPLFLNTFFAYGNLSDILWHAIYQTLPAIAAPSCAR